MTRQLLIAAAFAGCLGSGAALADDAAPAQSEVGPAKSAFPSVYRNADDTAATAPQIVASIPAAAPAKSEPAPATIGGMPIVDRPELDAPTSAAPVAAPPAANRAVAYAPASETPANELPATSATDDVVAEAEHWLGARNMTGRRGPWCGAFANFILQKTGHVAMSGENVAAALHYGRHLKAPVVGAMAVISTSYGREGHVGFVSGINDDGSIQLVSGNWANRVHDTRIPLRQVVAFVEVP